MTSSPSPIPSPSWLRWSLLAAALVWLLWKVLQVMDLGCATTWCSSGGLRNGLSLFAGALALAAMGAALLVLLPGGSNRGPGLNPSQQAWLVPRLFTCLGAGLVGLTAYVYLRSLINHAVGQQLPLVRPEFAVLLAVALLVIARALRKPGTGWVTRSGAQALLVDMLLLLVICLAVAEREMPRHVNLSSDPDQHAFFAFQIDRLGGVPWAQAAWGPLDFNYPAGSGVVLFIWEQFTGLGYLNLMPALPILFALVAALVLVEAVALKMPGVWNRGVVRIAAVGLTAAAFMFPLYREYVHQEGAARQLAMLPAALFLAVVVSELRGQHHDRMERAVMGAGALFMLVVLNPAHGVVPAVALVSLMWYAIHQGTPVLHLVGLSVAGLLLMLMDPYYQGLLGWLDRGNMQGVVQAERFVVKPWPEILTGAWSAWTDEAATLLWHMSVLFAETDRPLFLVFFLVHAFGLMLLHRHTGLNRSRLTLLVIFLLGLYVAFGFAWSLQHERRFFLLAPYVYFNMTQYKALLLTLLFVLVLKAVSRWPLSQMLLVGVSAALIYPVMAQVRDRQEMYLLSRKHYCGAFGCLPPEDLRLLKNFEQLVKSGSFVASSTTSKVLMPNAPMNTEHESWVLPVSSARVYPYFEVLPAAFYYYQGQPYYGTQSYYDRVCNTLDRTWLKEKHIDYVFLPSQRGTACLAGMEDLVKTEEVVLQDGGAWLLKFR